MQLIKYISALTVMISVLAIGIPDSAQAFSFRPFNQPQQCYLKVCAMPDGEYKEYYFCDIPVAPAPAPVRTPQAPVQPSKPATPAHIPHIPGHTEEYWIPGGGGLVGGC